MSIFSYEIEAIFKRKQNKSNKTSKNKHTTETHKQIATPKPVSVTSTLSDVDKSENGLVLNISS